MLVKAKINAYNVYRRPPGAGLKACWDTATAWRHWTTGNVHYQTEPNLLTFSESYLINDDSSFCSQILLKIDISVMFSSCSGKVLLNVFLSLNGILMTSDMTSSPRNDVAVLDYIF